jgi:membrane protease YdiL (CAAX protease family)
VYAELAVLAPAVVAAPVFGRLPNVVVLITSGSIVALLVLGGRRNLQQVVVVAAYALPCLLGVPWPVHCVTAAVAWYSWRIFGNRWSNRPHHPMLGSVVTIRRGGLAVLCGFACGGVAILLDWRRIVDLGLVLPVMQPAPAVALLGVVAIAAVNSIAEELFWREVLLDLTGGAVLRVDILVFQAVSFGLAHWNGVPSGFVGAVASGLFSILLVAARIRWGFSAAVLVHFAADLVIFSVIAQFAHYGSSGIFLTQ